MLGLTAGSHLNSLGSICLACAHASHVHACCRIRIAHIRGCYTEAQRFDAPPTGGAVVDAPLSSRGAAWHDSDMKITLHPPKGAGRGLWTVSGAGKDRDSRSTVNGIYNPLTGR